MGYVNKPAAHGHIYIILKQSLQYIPIIGWGMKFYGFIFMSRKMATDQPRMAYRLGKLKQTPGKGSAYPADAHPSGKLAHGRAVQVLRGLALGIYFFTCCVTYVRCA